MKKFKWLQLVDLLFMLLAAYSITVIMKITFSATTFVNGSNKVFEAFERIMGNWRVLLEESPELLTPEMLDMPSAVFSSYQMIEYNIPPLFVVFGIMIVFLIYTLVKDILKDREIRRLKKLVEESANITSS